MTTVMMMMMMMDGINKLSVKSLTCKGFHILKPNVGSFGDTHLLHDHLTAHSMQVFS